MKTLDQRLRLCLLNLWTMVKMTLSDDYQSTDTESTLPENNTNCPPNRHITVDTADNCKKNLKFLLINFQSILNKKPDLLTLISTEKPDVLIGTETWLTSDVMNSKIIPPEFGLTIYRKDRLSGYGGVLLAVSNRILSIDLPSLSTDCEIVWTKLDIIASPIYIAALATMKVWLHRRTWDMAA